MVAPTLTKRIVTAYTTTKKKDKLPLDYPHRAKAIRAKVLPAALYGCASSSVNDSALKQLRSSIAHTITKGSGQISHVFVYNIASYGTDLDANTEVLVR